MTKVFQTNLYNNIFDVLWKYLTKFEMNLMKMNCPKYLKTIVVNDFCYLKKF
jgi:hypothetical protein